MPPVLKIEYLPSSLPHLSIAANSEGIAHTSYSVLPSKNDPMYGRDAIGYTAKHGGIFRTPRGELGIGVPSVRTLSLGLIVSLRRIVHATRTFSLGLTFSLGRTFRGRLTSSRGTLGRRVAKSLKPLGRKSLKPLNWIIQSNYILVCIFFKRRFIGYGRREIHSATSHQNHP